MYKVLTEDNIKDFKDFQMKEFACKCGKHCDGFPVGFSYELAKNLQTIRNKYNAPLIITSALRCDKHNKSVGGVSNSRHKKGWAVDFYINNVSYEELADFVKSLPYFHYCYQITKGQNVIHYDITPPEEIKYEVGKYKLLVSKAIRLDHTLTDNIVKVGQCMKSVRPYLTKIGLKEKAYYKVGTIVDITEVFIDNENRVWGKLKNCWIVLCNKDGSPQAKMI